MNDSFVFSEEDRSWPGAVLGIALMQMMFLICGCIISFSVRSNPKPNSKEVLIVCGAVSTVYVFVLFFLLRKDDKCRSVTFELFDDSVCIRKGRTTRWLKASDDVCVSIRRITTGYKIAPLEKSYYVLWKKGNEVPQPIRNPFRSLNQFNYLLIPYSEQVRQKLIAIFGHRADLNPADDQMSEMGYVFPIDERVKHFFAKGIIQMLPAILLTVLINVHGITGIAFIVFFCGLIYTSGQNALLYVSSETSPSNSYSFARYQFSDDVVCMWLGEEKRSLHVSEPFQVSYKTLRFSERYGPSEKNYFVLWRQSESEPKNNIGAFELLNQTKAIVLPPTMDVRYQLKKTLGVEEL